MTDRFADVSAKNGSDRFWELAADAMFRQDARMRGFKTIADYYRRYGMLPPGESYGTQTRHEVSMDPEIITRIVDEGGKKLP